MDAGRPMGKRATRTLILASILLLSGLAAFPGVAEGQYFGRNKVQYDDFEFRVLPTDHFDIHYYEEEAEAIEDLARMSERWYERLARSFQHEVEEKKPLIIYADHPDFQQTNTLRGFVGESTGGVTESLKNRVILPMTGSYADTDHVLGHELVHLFQYNIAQSRRGGGLRGLSTLPLWLIEGMAEYLSVGRDDPLTGMWLRDAIVNDDFPTIRDLSREARFFPYRFGQALWAYVGGEYGDEAVIELFRRSLRIGFQPAIGQVLGISTDTLSSRWRRKVEQQYIPLMADRTDPDSVGSKVLHPETAGSQNVSPAISPDGRYIAFLSEKDLFSIDLFLADARTGEVVRKLASANSDPHADALRYVEAAGAWSPDSERFAYVIFAEGDNEIVIVDTESGDRERRIAIAEVGSIHNPTWSPDGRYLAFTGMSGGISDLYLYDLETDEVSQLTDDRNGDFHPTWSPDGTTIAFASDRGPETDFGRLTYSQPQISLLDVDTREVRVLPLFGNVRHTNPQYAPGGESLYFLSDRDGFADIYEVDLSSRDVRRITKVKTSVSGITPWSPAFSVAGRTGEMAFSVYTNFEFHVHTLPAGVTGAPIRERVADEDELRGRRLPPANPDRFSRVADYLGDPDTGLPVEGAYQTTEASDYDPSLELDFVGQPSIGVGTADRFGNFVGGGASAFFSDMLGNQLLGVAIQAQGTLKDIGGGVSYMNLSNRWNWGGTASRIPFQFLQIRQGIDDNGNNFIGQIRNRIFVSQASGQVAYPFSSTRRLEFSGGVVRYSFDIEEDRFILDNLGRVIDFRREDIDTSCDDAARGQLCKPDALNLAQLSAAWVGDNAFFGFTSPVRGGRFRFELQGTTGTEDFLTAITDWRRYWQPDRNLTIALRGLHYGRYGGIEDENVIQPLFLGFETFMRGYAWESFDSQEECISSQEGVPPGGSEVGSSCPALTRLLGQRLAVVNFEFRIPLLGVEQFGVLDFPFLPTELVFFQDAGLAWDADDEPVFELARTSSKRVPVFSTGVSARFNVLGVLILEAYYAQPWQRPEKGPHFGFQVAPGW